MATVLSPLHRDEHYGPRSHSQNVKTQELACTPTIPSLCRDFYHRSPGSCVTLCISLLLSSSGSRTHSAPGSKMPGPTQDRPDFISKPRRAGWLPADMLTAVLGSGDENKMPIGAAGKVQGRGFEVTETHSSLGLSEQGVPDTRDKLTCIQTPGWASRSGKPRARQFLF